jgi:hypothetical protein
MVKIISLDYGKDIELVLGTAIEFVAILNTDKPQAVTISITDPTNSQTVSNVQMTRLNSKIYSYIYQSAEVYNSGLYVATVSATNGGYTVVRQLEFELEEPLPNTISAA